MRQKVLYRKLMALTVIVSGSLMLLSGCGGKLGTTKEEQAALVAVEDLRDRLKSKQSMKLYSVDVKADDTYHVKIDYAAENSYGASLDDIQYYNVEKDTLELEKITEFSELFSNGGREEILEEEYEACSEKEKSIDTDWIMSNFE